MSPRDFETVAKGIGLALDPILKKAIGGLDDVLALIEDLQDQLDEAEARIAKLEERV